MTKYKIIKILFALIILVSFEAQGQEKRLALVIGNSSYEKGLLKNPVNDALLISETLKVVGFDVILKTNIANIKEFNDAVKEFGERRNQYNVGFIYYAGHAVQIDNINYLLATTEEYKTDYDVTVNAFSVQTMMRFLTDRSEEVNVLILDACRDNPFEKNWIKTSRSSEGGGGLAKINPPTGSLIAYSTDPGNTAEDGDDKNSLYCMSLSKNMLLENTSLDQVFRNVRADVLAETNNKQRPVEATQLTGEAFYLKKSTYLKDIKVIDSLIEIEDYTPALVKATSILTLDPNNMQALLRKGRISYNTLKNKYDGLDLKKAAKLYPNAPEVFIYLYRYYSTIENENEAFKQLKFALQLDSNYVETHYWLARYYMDSENNKEALVEMDKVIELDPKNGDRYYNRALFFVYKKDNNMALLDFSRAIELDPENIVFLYDRGSFYTDYLSDDKSAIKDFEQVLKIDPTYVDAINYIGLIYDRQGKLDLAIKEYEKGIALETTNPEAAAYCYGNRALIYNKQNLLDKALADYSKAIELDYTNAERHNNRAFFFKDYKQDNIMALLDYSKAIELDPKNISYLYDRGDFYTEYILDDESAIKDFEKILKIAPDYIDAINSIGVIYDRQGKLDLAIKEYEKGIVHETTNPEAAAYCYSNRARIYGKQNLLDKALADYTKAIELDPKNADRYYNRAIFYKDYKQDNNMALLDYSKAIELNPENIKYLYGRGLLYTNYLSVDKSAIKDFEQMLKIAPDNIDAINSIGVIYEHQGKLDLAIKEYEKGIELQTTSLASAAYCYSNRAGIYEKQNLLDKALADYSKAIELEPKNAERYYNRAIFYKDYQQDNNKALLDYSTAINLNPENVDYLYGRGSFYQYNSLDDKSAIKDFEQILKIAPDDIDAINSIGTIYDRQGKLDLAIKEYEKGIALEITNPEAAAYCYSNRAGIYKKQNLLDKALADYSKAIELDSKNAERHNTRAFFYKDYQQDNNLALLDYSKAIELDPEKNDYLYDRGVLFTYYLLDDKSAIKDFQQVLKIDSSYVDAINYLGKIYQKQGKLDLAFKEYEKGIALETSNPAVAAYCYSNRAGIYQTQNLLDKALTDYSKAIELDPENGDRYYNRAIFYTDYLQEYEKALMDYSKAIELEPKNGNRYANRAIFYTDYLKEYDKALIDYSKAMEIDPENEILINSRAHIYYKKGDFKSALDDYNLIVKTFPNAQSSFNKRGMFFTRIENYEKAQHDFEKAKKLDSNDRSVYYYKSKMHIQKKEYELAKKDLLKTIKMDDKDPEGYYYLAVIYELQGKHIQAIKHITFALSILENNKMNYYISDLNDESIPISQVYYKLGTLYEKLKEKELVCEYYQKALSAIENETRPNKIEFKKLLNEQIDIYCNE